MLSGRTTLYMIWKSCIRLGLLPPGIEKKWDDNVPYQQARMLAFEEILTYEEAQLAGLNMK